MIIVKLLSQSSATWPYDRHKKVAIFPAAAAPPCKIAKSGCRRYGNTFSIAGGCLKIVVANYNNKSHKMSRYTYCNSSAPHQVEWGVKSPKKIPKKLTLKKFEKVIGISFLKIYSKRSSARDDYNF
jgi:hypothetical protein